MKKGIPGINEQTKANRFIAENTPEVEAVRNRSREIEVTIGHIATVLFERLIQNDFSFADAKQIVDEVCPADVRNEWLRNPHIISSTLETVLRRYLSKEAVELKDGLEAQVSTDIQELVEVAAQKPGTVITLKEVHAFLETRPYYTVLSDKEKCEFWFEYAFWIQNTILAEQLEDEEQFPKEHLHDPITARQVRTLPEAFASQQTNPFMSEAHQAFNQLNRELDIEQLWSVTYDTVERVRNLFPVQP